MNDISLNNKTHIEVITRYQNIFAFILFIILAAYVLKANPFTGKTVAPFDLLLNYPGWSSVHQYHQAVNDERSDILDSQLPTWITLKNQIRAGRGALWDVHGAGGIPISMEICNPTFWLFLAIKDNAFAFYLVGLAKLVISGFGAYLLMKEFLRWLPSVWSGIVFMLCGFNAAWFFWDQVATAMWIPWLLWATVSYLRTDNEKWLPVITIVSLLMIFGGFPAVAAYGFYSFSLLVITWNVYNIFTCDVRLSTKKNNLKNYLKKMLFPILSVGLAFLMASIMLIPFLDALSAINLDYRRGGGTAFGLNDFKLFFSYENPPRVETTAYVGIFVCVLALFGIVKGFKKDAGKMKAFILFVVLLLIFSILITFGILPHRLIRAIPVFNSSPWNRLIVIPLLGMAMLSSIGMEYIFTTMPGFASRYLNISDTYTRRGIFFLLILIIVLQFHFQKKLFRSFNAVVPSSWFYPLTPNINYVKEHLMPLQSVIADNAYMISGTLGAYGIPEWYAHSFRTDKEKEILSSLVHDPFRSATAAVVVDENIQFQSPLMDKLLVKYLLINKRNVSLINRNEFYAMPDISHSPSPPLPENAWKQHIYIPKEVLVNYLSFFFATYRQEYAPANVSLSIRKDDDKKFNYTITLDKHEIKDNRWAYFMLPRRILFKKGNYSLGLSLPNYTGPEKLTVWATNYDQNSGSYLDVNGAKSDLSLRYSIGTLGENDRWNVISLENDIVILENKLVTNSSYFVKTLDTKNNQIDFTGIDVKLPSAELINIRYTKNLPGWIVLPMHLHHGWKAFVNEQQVKYDVYLGILPAIPVKGAGRIVFKYEPQSFITGVVLSIIGFVLFIMTSIICIITEKNRQKYS